MQRLILRFFANSVCFSLSLIILTAPVTLYAADSIQTVNSVGDVRLDSSLALDSNGFPVIAYRDGIYSTDGHLKLVHCNDPA
jgi:hypothetical protein